MTDGRTSAAAPDAGLAGRFTALLGEAPGAAALAAGLLRRWAEPQRHYHTTGHLRAVLGHLDEAGLRGHAADPAAVALAAWFHDAVYDPAATGTADEEESARLAERTLPGAGAGPELTAEVARLVRLTADHDPATGDTNGEALCDADLAVLGYPPEEYAAYTAAVRREYGFVPPEAFRAGRAEVLRRLLSHPRLYRTPHAVRHWEPTARYNLTAELELLTR
ncbi:metal-dependent phosphohydrolase [Streptomyces sp. YIM 98790]|uniref:HD domain-containing protein n=1 Tax=Streptomyces sp. YIM 98790 TaxID=2689077 RepID=UPI001409A15B|nr:metal-dependent phosphohydrolase [Streptomyces sp. YIM 98790]